ncbi:hypothetical protein CHY08_34160 (plasmid) [Rhizobium leguminosarum bv. viciae]|uniref:hypothetical protein n=1 Tax=Rhizobium leguminosarum TaxID=384 RepID=UPI000B8C9E36|nr:hypothetical protein [Rhizobium leguminosarum]ASR12102.1 hypothetical protein CHY08_34160 [Rhizobium leguminosarum bv. viciae]
MIKKFFNVQDASHGTALYLDRECEWTTDAEAAFSYEDEEDANADADKHGGEVFKFECWRPERRDYSESARLEHVFASVIVRGATLHSIAAE